MFNNCVVLITGAASGIGLESSKLFLQEGAIVVGADFNEQALAEAGKKLGDRFFPQRCDVTKEDHVGALAQFLDKSHGKLDTLINNAGAGNLVGLETMQESDFNFHYDINVKGPMLMVKHCIPLLRKSANPSILNISSSAGRVEHTQNHFLYSTSKAALLKFTQHLVRDFPGIRANTILPGWVDTPIYSRAGVDDAVIKAVFDRAVTRIPAGRIGTPSDIAHAVLFLSSEKASYINGASLDINGGLLCNADWGFLF
ncbi:MAG: SDR family oxidoreductase [Candidatus Lindowbacteria bacterium]|nr:SDR family oxidoreductase [Candidatus Lindowbacteria bacterium]